MNGMPGVQLNKSTKKTILSRLLSNGRFAFPDRAERGVELVEPNSTGQKRKKGTKPTWYVFSTIIDWDRGGYKARCGRSHCTTGATLLFLPKE